MSWAQIDDQSTFHAKVVRAGNAAWGALCRMIAWSSAHGTDGRIAAELVSIIASDEEREQLVRVGLLDQTEEGFEIHDFLEWNRSAKEVDANRKKRAKAGQIGGLRSGSKRQASAQASASGLLDTSTKQNPTLSSPLLSSPNGEKRESDPPKVPEGSAGDRFPEPERPSGTRKVGQPRAAAKFACPEDWSPSEQTFVWAAAKGVCRAAVMDQRERFLLWAPERGGKRPGWDRTFMAWIQRALDERKLLPDFAAVRAERPVNPDDAIDPMTKKPYGPPTPCPYPDLLEWAKKPERDALLEAAEADLEAARGAR